MKQMMKQLPKKELWLQITAGQGPVECAWAVVKVLERIQQEANAVSVSARVIELEPGVTGGTVQSALVAIEGDSVNEFARGWHGTVQWITRSPFRPQYKRKNWFVGVDVLQPVEETRLDARDVQWETMRASGPGGQHVNRTESAVRVTHLPSGIQASAMEERSQHRNRKLAFARLIQKLGDLDAERQGATREKRWRAHHDLERGNPVRTFREP